MNQHLVSFLQTLQGRYSIDSVGMSMGDWICSNTAIRGRPFSFNRYPFQRAIADDMHADLSCKKCSQTGLTEIQIRKELGFLVRNRGTKGIYTMPNLAMFKRVSQARITPIITENKVFNTEEDLKSIRSMGLIQIGTSFLYITASNEGDATSIDADVVFNDEVDLTDQQMLTLFTSRLQNSDFKIKQRFSTPTFTGYGIDKSYSISDQHEYMIKCDSCNHWQVPDFERKFVIIPGLPDHINDLAEIDEQLALALDLDEAYVCCERCQAGLDLGREDNREWVATFTGRSTRGYQVRPFSGSRISVKYIIEQLLEYKRNDYVRGFYNTTLGKSYMDGNVRLSEADIDACFEQKSIPSIDSRKEVFVGIDMGQMVHLVIGTPTADGKLSAFYFDILHVNQLLERVQEICDTYNVVAGCCDRLPYTPTAEAVQAISKGRIWPVEYKGTKSLNPIKDLEGNTIYFQADRTSLLDGLAKEVRNHTLSMSGYGEYRGIIKEHLQDMVRDEKPEEPAKWVKLNGNDHFFHALAFMRKALAIRGVLVLQSDVDERVSTSVAAVQLQFPGLNLGGISNRRVQNLVSLGLRR